MRKRIVGLSEAGKRAESDHGWLDLEQIATVEITSEDPPQRCHQVRDADIGGIFIRCPSNFGDIEEA